MKTFTQFLYEKASCQLFTAEQLAGIEKFGDMLLNKFGIDIEFTKHFKERLSDSRNKPCISGQELIQLFNRISQDQGKKIKEFDDRDQAVLVDTIKSLNLPFVLDIKNGEFIITFKTIMRKKDFKTPDPKVRY